MRDWKKPDTQEAAFLHEAHAGACQYFTTVLGPGADVFHYNHIHLDLANHGATDTGPRRICRPTPAPSLLPPPAAPDGLPPAPEIDEPLDVAHLSAPAPEAPAPPAQPALASSPDVSSGPGDGPDVALPPAPIGQAGLRPRDPVAPILPAGVDPTPTSAIRSRDD